VIDSNLQFDDHISGKVKTANRILGLLKRCFNNLDINSFLLLYKSFVRSHLEYAQTVWSPYKVKSIEALEGVQRRATKILPGFGTLAYKERLQRLKLPTLVYRRARGDMIEVYKILRGYYDPESVPCLQKCIYPNTRGHTWKLYQLQSHLKCRECSFTVSDDGTNCRTTLSMHQVYRHLKIVLISTGHARSFCTISRHHFPEAGILSTTPTVKIWICLVACVQ